MALAMFYHLTRSGPEATVALLLGRARGQGWRVMVRGTAPERLAALDEQLWTEPADGFLPHGMEGGPADALQPVLLGCGPIANAAQGLMLVDGAEAELAEVRGLERVWVIFDGNDSAAVEGARGLWRRITGAGIAAQYWAEDGGRWEKRTERAAGDPAAG
jgi:DNA polymerase III subunit chi